MQNHDMLIVKKAYDFSKWLLLHTGKFPKSYRFSIAVRIENAVLEFTGLVALAYVRHETLPFLEQADSRKPLKARRAGRFDTAFGLLSVRVSGTYCCLYCSHESRLLCNSVSMLRVFFPQVPCAIPA